jgi:hypothetical protein
MCFVGKKNILSDPYGSRCMTLSISSMALSEDFNFNFSWLQMLSNCITMLPSIGSVVHHIKVFSFLYSLFEFCHFVAISISCFWLNRYYSTVGFIEKLRKVKDQRTVCTLRK